jgi:crotonobetainyl-CoA:carnitine CoA-transferase CaiB-like acyl-CoA transferase
MPHAEMGEASEFDSITPRLSATPGALRTASPLIGEHTAHVMQDILGLSPEQFAEHEEMGVFM